ncbi:hypothetical protein KEM55_002539 [Ascosphaera atra]|nr:hypothetical protein KEM55_002539 [Ascosphaera atra]
MDTSYTFPFRHIHSRSASTLAAQDIVKSYHNAAADTSAPVMCLTPTQRNYLASAIRVNQAGELAARLIYIAQAPPIQRSQPELRTLMRHMYDQEQGHFDAFNGLIAEHKVRPTAMYSIWEYAASFLGWSTAVMGREVAMACTEAVETEIGGHYNQQISTVFEWFADARERGERPNAELVQLVQDLRRIRDEELEHLDLSVEQEAKEAKPYEPLVGVIRLGCRAAIKISERL